MRKGIVKYLAVVLIAISMATAGIGTGDVLAKNAVRKERNKLGKVLIVYYSFSGNTRLVAKRIQSMTGGDLVELKPVENYHRPDIEAIAKQQVNEGYKPKLQNEPIDIGAYDCIFVGTPVWWFSFAPPVGTFLAQHDFKGKKVAPFWTYIDGQGATYSDFKKACRGGKVLAGRDFTTAELQDMKKVNAKIKAWLEEL